MFDMKLNAKTHLTHADLDGDVHKDAGAEPIKLNLILFSFINF